MNPGSTTAKVLIVEDDPVVARLYSGQLENRGYAVDITTDGVAGFARLNNHRPNVVLLDLMLPRMNGVDVLKKIRAHPDFREIPVIVLTNAYVPLMVRDAYDAGATAVHDKSSFGPHELVEALRACLPETRPRADHRDPPPSAPTAADQARHAFLAQTPADLATLRSLLRQVDQSADEVSRGQTLGRIYSLVHGFTGRAALAGLQAPAQMASALEALLKELLDKPDKLSPAALRTVVMAVDSLQELCAPGVESDFLEGRPLEALVVDDDPICQCALALALEKSTVKPVCVNQSTEALAAVGQRPFDAIFLDVGMPGENGFAICQSIRSGGPNKDTPVVFVTQHTDFKDRVQSTLSGANDFVAKPFLPIEVSVKALGFCLRNRLQRRRSQAD